MRLRMEKILVVVLHEAYEKQVEETMDALTEGSESFYSTVLRPAQNGDSGTD